MDIHGLEPWSEVVCPVCGGTVRARTSFRHYLLIREVGQGGMSRVFQARDESLGRDLALKILHSGLSQDDRRLRQFEREAMITASISHPNVVKVYTAGRDRGHFFMAMELVEGGSLDEKIRRSGRLDEAWGLELAEKVTGGLKEAYGAGLIHRDIKPGNILLSREGTPKIVDFGLAVFAREGVDDSEIWATPYYVPPETLLGEPEDFRSDLYALGSTLYHCLMGRPLYDSDTNSLAQLKALKSKPADLREAATVLSRETVAVLERCLKRRPADRYATYDEFLDHLAYARRRLSRGGSGKPWPGSQGLTPRQWAFVAALAVAGIGTALWWNHSPHAAHGVDGPAGAAEMLMADGSGLTPGTDRTISSKFLQARGEMAAGRFLKAREEFSALATDAAIRQPTLNWARWNAALAALFLGDLAAARRDFTAIRSAGPFSQDPADAAAAHFFVTHAALMETELPAGPGHMAEFPGDSPFAIGLLACGLKNWLLGDLTGASRYFQAFEAATPPRQAAWIAAYRNAARPWIEDMRLIDSLPPLPLTDTLPGPAETRLAGVRSRLAGMTLPDLTRAAVESRLTAVAAAVESLKASIAEKEAALLEAATREEMAALLQVEAGTAPLGYELDFAAGSSRLRALKTTTAAAREALSDRLQWWENAQSFLEVLAHDLSTPLDGSIDRLAGGTVRGQIAGAPEGLKIRPASGPEVTLPFTGCSPASLAALAERTMDRISGSDEYYRRRELLVAFALRCGLKNYALVAGHELARENPAFRGRWLRRGDLP